MDQRTTKLMIIHKAFHSRDDMDKQEKKVLEYSPALKKSSMHQYQDSKTTLKLWFVHIAYGSMIKF